MTLKVPRRNWKVTKDKPPQLDDYQKVNSDTILCLATANGFLDATRTEV